MKRCRLALVALSLIAITAAALDAPPARAQTPDDLPLGVELDVTVTREGDTIGDPVHLTVVVTHPADGELLVPPPEGPLGQLEPAAPTVTRTTGPGGAQRVTLVYETRAFVTGLLSLQPPRLSYRTQAGIASISPPPQIIDVRSLLPADGSLLVRPLKPAETVPQPGFPIWAAGLGAGILTALVAGELLRRARRRPRVAPPIAEPPFSPALAASRDLDGIGDAGLLPQAVDEFCARVNTSVRGYLATRYRVPALNLTASELGERLAGAGADAGTVQRVRSLCRACDDIAYAGATPSPERVARYLDLAQAIVQPQPSPVEAAPQPTPAPRRWDRPPEDD